jgi:hypothetical protein
MNSKKCTKCGIEKPLTEFYKRTSSRDGLDFICKTCSSKKSAKYRAQNKEKLAQYNTEYRAENRENILKKQAEYRKNNPEKVNESMRKWRKKKRIQDPEKVNESTRKWREKKRIQDPEFFKKQLSQEVDSQISCIYRIKNLINGKVYVGQTISNKRRWMMHKSQLRGGYHGNHYLQDEFNKYGEEVFVFDILEKLEKDISKDEMLDRESCHIQMLLSEGVELYNHEKPDRGEEQ